jgi:Transposase DDE domain
MQQFITLELLSYLLMFQTHFSKPNFVYFQGYLWGLLLAGGRKTMNNIAHCCFWVERNLSSWERFLSDNLWDGVIPLILELKKSLGLNSLRVVVDAYFSKVPFLSPLVDKLIHVITRMRKDAVAWDNRTEDKSKKSFVLDGKWKLAHLLKEFKPQSLSVKIYGKSIQVEAVEREVYIRGFQPKVKVVVMKGDKEPIILLSTDITLTAIQIIEIYGSRFSIELAIRDLKQHFGLGDYQCYLGIAIDRFVQLACVAYSLFRLFQMQQVEPDWMPKVSASCSAFSFSRLRRGLQHFAITQVLSQKSAPEGDLTPCSRELDQILRLAA